MAGITIRRRVYYDDTDSGGVVYHTNYLRYMEHARTDYLHQRDMSPAVLEERHGILFVVAGMNVRYLAPARLGEELAIGATLQEVGRAAIRFDQAVWLYAEDKCVKELVRADVNVVCINAKTFRPVRIPQAVREHIASDQ